MFGCLKTERDRKLRRLYIDEIDDRGEQEWTSALPPVAWVEEHKELLESIFGDTERYDNSLATITTTTTTGLRTCTDKGSKKISERAVVTVVIVVLVTSTNTKL